MIRRIVGASLALAAIGAVAPHALSTAPAPAVWNAIVAVGPAGELTVVDRSGGTAELDQLVEGSIDASYGIVTVRGARVVLSDGSGFGRLAILDAGTGSTHYFDGHGPAQLIRGTDRLLLGDAGSDRLIVDIDTLTGVRLDADLGVRSSVSRDARHPDPSHA